MESITNIMEKVALEIIFEAWTEEELLKIVSFIPEYWQHCLMKHVNIACMFFVSYSLLNSSEVSLHSIFQIIFRWCATVTKNSIAPEASFYFWMKYIKLDFREILLLKIICWILTWLKYTKSILLLLIISFNFCLPKYVIASGCGVKCLFSYHRTNIPCLMERVSPQNK